MDKNIRGQHKKIKLNDKHFLTEFVTHTNNIVMIQAIY